MVAKAAVPSASDVGQGVPAGERSFRFWDRHVDSLFSRPSLPPSPARAISAATQLSLLPPRSAPPNAQHAPLITVFPDTTEWKPRPPVKCPVETGLPMTPTTKHHTPRDPPARLC